MQQPWQLQTWKSAEELSEFVQKLQGGQSKRQLKGLEIEKGRQGIDILKYVLSKASSISKKKAFSFRANKTGEKYIWKGCVTHMAGGERGLDGTILVMM